MNVRAAPLRPPQARLVLVDDHAMVRQGLRSMLEREPDLVVVGEAGDAEGALETVAETAPDVVVLDLKLGSDAPDGLAVCAALTSRHPDVAVVVLTTFLDEQLVVEAVRRGARGYVLKDVDVAELVRLIRAVQRGEEGFDSRTVRVMRRTLATGNVPLPAEVSARELQVARLIGAGRSNREIGEALAITESTVKFHVRNLMRKLGAARRAEVVYEATKRGLL